MSNQSFGIALHTDVPSTILDMFAEYLLTWNSIPHLRSSSVDYVSSFVSLSISKADKSGDEWNVLIPTAYVLAIIDMSAGKPPIGYLGQSLP